MMGHDSPGRPVDVSVVVVNYNTAHLLDEMWASLETALGALEVQVVVVDNASRDDSVARLHRDFAGVQLLVNDANVGFGRANNQALPLARGRYVLLLNTDAFVAPDTLVKTVAYMDSHLDCGILGVRLVGRAGELQPSCRYFPTPINVFLHRAGLGRLLRNVRMVDDLSWDHRSIRECDWVPGCYYLVRREVIEQVGLFDPRYFLYYEEVDHCRMAKRAGWKVVYFGDTEVTHLGGESAKSAGSLTASGKQLSALQVESELLYFRKHYGLTGVLAAIVLVHVAHALAAVKALFRRPQRGHWAAAARGVRQYWRLIARTRLGLRPTR